MKNKKILALLMLTGVLGIGVTQITSCSLDNIEPEVETTKYKVTAETSTDYSITGLKAEGYAENETVTFKVELTNENILLDSVKVNGNVLEATDDTYSFTMGTADVKIEVNLIKSIKYYRENATTEGIDAQISGVVTKIIMNQGNSFIAGFFVADSSDQMYVYTSKQFPIKGIKEGDKVTVKGSAINYKKNATDKFFSFQLSNPELVDEVEGDFKYDKSIETKSSVLEIRDLPTNESYVGRIYTADCKIAINNEQYGTFNFVSPDETYSLPSYSQSAKTHEWLKQYDGQWKNVSFAMFTPKSSNGNIFWRVVPIAVNGDYTQTDKDLLANYIDEAEGKFNKKYYSKTSVDLLSVSEKNEKVKFTYESTNKDVADIEVNEGKTSLNIKKGGNTSIKITAQFDGTDKKLTSDPIEISVITEAPQTTIKTFADVRKESLGANSKVSVKGIVVGGIYANGNDGKRFNSYYVMDNTDTMIVNLQVSEWSQIILEKGMEVYFTGEKDVYEDGGNSISIRNATIDFIAEGTHEWPFTPEEKTLTELYNSTVDPKNNLGGKVYYMNVKLTGKENSFSGQFQYYISEIGNDEVTKNVYQASKTNVDSFLREYLDKEIHCLVGIHDAKNGHYRYDIVPGTIELKK